MATFFGESIINVVYHSATGGNIFTVPTGQYARVTVNGISGATPGGGSPAFVRINGNQIARNQSFTVGGTAIPDEQSDARAIVSNPIFLQPNGTITHQNGSGGNICIVNFTIALFNLP